MANKLSTTWKHIRRSPYQALSAIAVLTFTFYMGTIFAFTSFASHKILEYFETRPQVTAFFKDDATQETIESIKKELEGNESVSSTKFVSKEEALAIYREQNKQDPLLLEMVTADILPASLEVSGRTAASLPQIAEILKSKDGVEEVVYQQDVIEAVGGWAKGIRGVGIENVGFLVVTSILTITAIISMKIALRRHEIEVMRLIGASTWYIKNPFILEGMFYGIMGALIGWGAAYLRLLYATPQLINFLGNIALLPIPIEVMLLILAGEMIFAIIVGGLASFIAVKRFLR